MMRNLWKDEAGFIISAELVLVATIVVIGMIVGLVSLRNQVVQELVDVGQAIGSLSQSYCFSGVKGICEGQTYAWVDGTCYIDLIDFCQASQTAHQGPGGVMMTDLPAAHTSPTGGESEK
jgi:hypothetical protein